MIVYMLKRLVIDEMEFPQGALCEMPEDKYAFTQSCNNWRDFYSVDHIPDAVEIVLDGDHFAGVAENIRLRREAEWARQKEEAEERRRQIEEKQKKEAEERRRLREEADRQLAEELIARQAAEAERQRQLLETRQKRLDAAAERRRKLKEELGAEHDTLLSDVRKEIKRLNAQIDGWKQRVAERDAEIADLKRQLSLLSIKQQDEAEEDVITKLARENRRLERRLLRYRSDSIHDDNSVDAELIERFDGIRLDGKGRTCMGHGTYRSMPVRCN